jgi:uncharacterized FAD-dependent dehydrogenase
MECRHPKEIRRFPIQEWWLLLTKWIGKIYKQFGALAAMEYQKSVEQKAWQLAGQTQIAPAQKMQDFVHKKVSSSLLETSYQPGLVV